jgi:hypothetical protein
MPVKRSQQSPNVSIVMMPLGQGGQNRALQGWMARLAYF